MCECILVVGKNYKIAEGGPETSPIPEHITEQPEGGNRVAPEMHAFAMLATTGANRPLQRNVCFLMTFIGC